MAPEDIIFFPILELGSHSAVLCCAHFSMMQKDFLWKCSRLPSLHPGGEHRHQIDPSGFCRDIPANFLKALSPEHLALAGDMLDSRKAIVVLLRTFPERSP